jgi:hypothetical protein
MRLKHVIHIVGGAVALLAIYDMVAPGVSAKLPVLPSLPFSNNMTNLVVGGGIWALPFFFKGM